MSKEYRPSVREMAQVGWNMVRSTGDNAYNKPEVYDWIVETIFKRSKLAADVVRTTQRYLPCGVDPHSIKVLDEATGTGTVALAFAQQGYDVTAIDIMPTALMRLQSKAQERNLAIATSQADFNKSLQYPDKSFHVITSVAANRYITEQNTFLNEVHRMLKDGGVFVWPIFSFDIPLWKRRVGIQQPTFSFSLAKELRKHGFRDVRVEMIGSIVRNMVHGIPLYAIPIYLIAKINSNIVPRP